MRANRIVLAAASLLVAFPMAQAQIVDRGRTADYGRRYLGAPSVDVWIDRYSFRPGERLHAYFESEPGAFVTILRVTTAGDVRVLYPRTPGLQRAYTGDRLVDDEVPYTTEPDAFYLNEPEGVGFVFAVASFEPFDYRAFASGDRWSTFQLTGNRYGDPFNAMNRFVARTLSDRADYSTDYIQYEVFGSGRYRDRGYVYSSYDDLYSRCLNLYGLRVRTYCSSYADFGDVPFIIGRVRPTPSPRDPIRTGGKKRTAAPRTFVPDPVVGDEGVKPQVPTQRSPSNDDVKRAWWDLQRRDAARKGDVGRAENTLRVEPRTPSPGEVRGLQPAPRIDVRPQPRSEPAPQRRYEPAPQQADPQPRFQPATVHRSEPEPRFRPEPAQRSEPQPRVETRQETRPAPPPQRIESHGDPAPRQIHPPPPPVDRGSKSNR